MGGSSYSDETYKARREYHRTSGTDYFVKTEAIVTGKEEAKVDNKLDPSKLNKAGKNIREAFDSIEHPNSRPIAVLFDVTGSMANTPRVFVEKLNKLMAALVKKGYVNDPQILFGAIGDATTDKTPLQIGQFESGNEMDEALSLIYLEGGGGSYYTESYELGMYYMARHTDLDSVKKRGEKGYLFLMGDEIPYDEVEANEVQSVIGDKIQSNIPTEEILNELREKFEVFWIIPNQTSHYDDERVLGPLRKMFGQNLLKLDNPSDIVEFIVSTIGISEGYDLSDIKADLKDIGADAEAVTRASKALVSVRSSRSVTKTGTVSGSIPKSGKKDAVAKV